MMIKLAVINRVAGVIGALAVCLAVTGCIGREEFDKVTKDLKMSMEANKTAAADEQAALRADLEKASASLEKQVAAIQTELVGLRKILTLGARVDTVEKNVLKQFETLDMFRKDLASMNVKVAEMGKKLDNVASRDSVIALRKDMDVKVNDLEAKDAELAKASAEKDSKQDTSIEGLEAVSDEAVKDLGICKAFITKLDVQMQDHVAWTLKAVGEQDKTIIDHSKNLREALLATVKALEAQLTKMKAVASAIKIHKTTSAPVSE